MKYIGYIRVSTDKQDGSKQKHLILGYCQRKQIVVDQFIDVEISSTKSQMERKIDELKSILEPDDILICAELSRLARNMLEALNLIDELTQKNIKIIFIRQPELSTNAPHTKLLFAIYSYFAESERVFISMRTKAGLAKVKADGVLLGRRTGSRNKKPLRKLSPYRSEIMNHLEIGLPLSSIHKIIDGKLKQYGSTVSYHQLRYYILKDSELSLMIQ